MKIICLRSGEQAERLRASATAMKSVLKHYESVFSCLLFYVQDGSAIIFHSFFTALRNSILSINLTSSSSSRNPLGCLKKI